MSYNYSSKNFNSPTSATSATSAASDRIRFPEISIREFQERSFLPIRIEYVNSQTRNAEGYKLYYEDILKNAFVRGKELDLVPNRLSSTRSHHTYNLNSLARSSPENSVYNMEIDYEISPRLSPRRMENNNNYKSRSPRSNRSNLSSLRLSPPSTSSSQRSMSSFRSSNSNYNYQVEPSHMGSFTNRSQKSITPVRSPSKSPDSDYDYQVEPSHMAPFTNRGQKSITPVRSPVSEYDYQVEPSHMGPFTNRSQKSMTPVGSPPKSSTSSFTPSLVSTPSFHLSQRSMTPIKSPASEDLDYDFLNRPLQLGNTTISPIRYNSTIMSPRKSTQLPNLKEESYIGPISTPVSDFFRTQSSMAPKSPENVPIVPSMRNSIFQTNNTLAALPEVNFTPRFENSPATTNNSQLFTSPRFNNQTNLFSTSFLPITNNELPPLPEIPVVYEENRSGLDTPLSETESEELVSPLPMEMGPNY